MQGEIKLGLDFLLRGKIVVLEGTGHPRILEELLKLWRAKATQEIEVSREGVTRKITIPGGSTYELSMLSIWEQGTFSEEKARILGEAGEADLLAVSHLGFEVPQAYRIELVKGLILRRLEKVRLRATPSPFPPCAILGVDGPPGTLRTRYGDDLARAVGEVGVFIETP